MRKSLLIGLIVCVLAISGIGAAFTTGMTFGGVGALSTGNAPVPQANVDGVVWVVEDNCTVGSPDAEPEAYWVKLSFDRDLGSTVHIGVGVLDINDNVLRRAWTTHSGPITDATLTDIKWPGGPVPVKDIYGLRVTVSEETP